MGTDCDDAREVLLVARADRRSTIAVRRAAELGRLSRSRVRVVVCAVCGTDPAVLRDARRSLAACIPSAAFETRVGSPLAIASAMTRERRPRLLVLAATDVDRADRVIELAIESRVDVLVARPSSPRSSVVAATDLQDETAPVLNAASRFASTIGADLFAVHNVVRATPQMTWRWRRRLVDRIEDVGALRDRLAHALARIDPEGQVLMGSTPDTAQLVTDLADALRADTIAVGGRAATTRRSPFCPTVAERVLVAAKMSVLVTPILHRSGFDRP